MKSLETLVQDEITANAEKLSADITREMALSQLYQPLKELFPRFNALFEPIEVQSRRLGLAVQEIYEPCPPSDNLWGNQAIVRVLHLPSGFTLVYTENSFRNEKSVTLSAIPSKYLRADGNELMQADAKRITEELATLRDAREAAKPTELGQVSGMHGDAPNGKRVIRVQAK